MNRYDRSVDWLRVRTRKACHQGRERTDLAPENRFVQDFRNWGEESVFSFPWTGRSTLEPVSEIQDGRLDCRERVAPYAVSRGARLSEKAVAEAGAERMGA